MHVIARCVADGEFARNYIANTQPDTETLCLKESWDGLHYLLSPSRRRPAKELDTMVVWDTSDLLAAGILGKEILNRDCSYGFSVPKWISPEMAEDISELLGDIQWEDLVDEVVPEKMIRCGVYPEGLWDDEAKAAKFLRYWFQRFVKFYSDTARKNQAVISYMKL